TPLPPPSFPTRRSSDLGSPASPPGRRGQRAFPLELEQVCHHTLRDRGRDLVLPQTRGEECSVGAVRRKPGLDQNGGTPRRGQHRSEEHTSELQSRFDLV